MLTSVVANSSASSVTTTAVVVVNNNSGAADNSEANINNNNNNGINSNTNKDSNNNIDIDNNNNNNNNNGRQSSGGGGGDQQTTIDGSDSAVVVVGATQVAVLQPSSVGSPEADEIMIGGGVDDDDDDDQRPPASPTQIPSSVGQSGLSMSMGSGSVMSVAATSDGNGLISSGGGGYGGHHHHSHGHGGGGGGGAGVQHDHPDTKEGIEELCPVCGDKVSGYHYGLLTCESCKGFFKRTVQNKKVYTCVADRSCHIDKSQRKRCPFCRFQKCLDVGMKLEAVRADRMRGGRNKFGPMYKRDRARRLQLLRQKQLTRPPCQAPPPVSMNHSTGAGGDIGPHFLAALHGAPTHIYTADGIKQELIQIPQLSSSTSSPDSSPSPGQQALVVSQSATGQHFVTVGGGPPQQQQQQQQQPQPPGGDNNNVIQPQPPHGPTQVGPNGAGIHSPVPTHETLKWGPHGGGGPNDTAGAASAGTPTTLSPKNGAHFHYESAPSTAAGGGGGHTAIPLTANVGKIPPLVREFQLTAPDDKEWQSQLFGLLQNQTYNQCEVDLFELMCKVIDQSLFAQVDWARNSIFFKDLKVDDQMKLLQHAWSDMLVLDHIHQRLHVGLPDETTLPNGQKFDLLSLALLGVPSVVDQLHAVTARLTELKFDSIDYICLKFLLLLNPDVRGLGNFKLVQEAHEQAQQAVLEYTINCYPQIADKFGQLMALVPDIRALTLRGEEYLYYKHMGGSAPTQTLLMEMLHAKKK